MRTFSLVCLIVALANLTRTPVPRTRKAHHANVFGHRGSRLTLVPTKPANDAGYTREIIDVSRLTHFPLRVTGYQGASLVRQVGFVAVQLTH